MIVSNDVRIGNWVKLNRKNIKVTASFIGRFHNVKANAIKIKPSILEQAGFVFNDKQSVWVLSSFGLYVEQRKENEYHLTNHRKSMWLGRFKYVHQLQNLFYCLTQKELTINL